MDFSAGKNRVGCTGSTAAVAHSPLLLAATDIIAQIVTDTAAAPSRYRFISRLLIIHGCQSVQNQERPYHVDRTTSRPLCEVKRRRARLVLRWGTTWEALVLFLFFACANDHGHAHSSFLPAVLYVPPPNRPFIHSFIHSVLKLLLCVHYSHFIYNRPVPTLFYTCCGPSDSPPQKKASGVVVMAGHPEGIPGFGMYVSTLWHLRTTAGAVVLKLSLIHI